MCLAFSLAWKPSLRPMGKAGSWDKAPAWAYIRLSVEGISLTPNPTRMCNKLKFAQSARSCVAAAGAWAPFQTLNYFFFLISSG